MTRIYRVSVLRGSLALTLATLAAACAERPSEPASQRLVDLAGGATVTGTPPPAEPPEGAVWTFGDAAAHGWQAASGVADLRVEGGALVGRSTDDMPILHLAWRPDADPQEPVHAVEVRMASSAPGRLRAEFSGEEDFVAAQAAGDERARVTRRTVSRPHVWMPLTVDLDRWSGREVELELSLAGESAGVLGFWGSPAVRQRIEHAEAEGPLRG